MKSIELEELKNIQLDIMQVLHDFCKENGIKYSLACGSLLGAIRHNGYIPWDDDIDVYMERDDYNKFISLFPKSYKGIYEFSCLTTDTHWHIPYGKLYDNRTIVEEKEGLSIGVNIDIFPVDAVPNDSKRWIRYNRWRNVLREILTSKFLCVRKGRSLLKNFLLLVLKILLFFISARYLASLLDRYAQLFNGESSASLLFENVQGKFQKSPFDKDDFKATILHKFENREFCIMKGYDHCLKCGFGDYMKLPPAEKQVSHHIFYAYWK